MIFTDSVNSANLNCTLSEIAVRVSSFKLNTDCPNRYGYC